MERALNEQFLQGNTCFGCGPANKEGLQIRIFRDGTHDDRLVGTFQPRETMTGFPFIVHGGLQLTALDCMAGWCVFILRARGQKIVPLTTTASMRYARAVKIGMPVSLRARIVKEAASPKGPLAIDAAIVDENGKALSEASFEYVMLPQESFKRVVGVDVMPDTYRRHFGEL